ncbi:MAG: hypothetical protein WAN68_12210, partial [Pseudolabrys sp.]
IAMANEVPAPVVFDNDLREQAAQNTLAANPLVPSNQAKKRLPQCFTAMSCRFREGRLRVRQCDYRPRCIREWSRAIHKDLRPSNLRPVGRA